MQYFKNLEVYKKAFSLSVEVYRTIETSKNFRLKGQLFGSTTSVCANLAEFASAESAEQKLHKLRICLGEINETEFWLDFCREVLILDGELYSGLMMRNTEIRRMIYSIFSKIKSERNRQITAQNIFC